MTVDSRIRELEGSGPLRYGVHVSRSTDQTIVTATTTPIAFDTVVEDVFGIWADASATSRFKVPIGGAGLYIAETHVRWNNSSTATSGVGVRTYDETGVQVPSQLFRSPQSTTTINTPYQTAIGFLALSERWEVEAWVLHASGANRDINTVASGVNSPATPYFKMYRITR